MRRLLIRLWPILALVSLPMLAGPASAADLPKPWETSVRVKRAAGQSATIGSGTVVASNEDASIVLSCAHLFRELTGKLTVDLFDPDLKMENGTGVLTYRETHPARLLAVDPTQDLSLIEIRPGRRLPASPIAPQGTRLTIGQRLVAVGCSDGGDAKAWTTRVTELDVPVDQGRVTALFTACEFAPKEGRSGGGLFTPDGVVVGVVDFADAAEKRGLYATPESIDRIVATAGLKLVEVAGRRWIQGGPCPGGACPKDVPRSPQRGAQSARAGGQSFVTDPAHLPAIPTREPGKGAKAPEQGYADVYPIAPTKPDGGSPGWLAQLEGQAPDNTPYIAGGAGVVALLWRGNDRRRSPGRPRAA